MSVSPKLSLPSAGKIPHCFITAHTSVYNSYVGVRGLTWDIVTYSTVAVQERHTLPEGSSGCSAHVAVGFVLITVA